MEQKYVKEAFDTNWVVPMGPNVNAFEQDLANSVNSSSEGAMNLDRKVVCLSAGTAAVHLALIGCGVQAGDDVIVQSFTLTFGRACSHSGSLEQAQTLLSLNRSLLCFIASYHLSGR